MVQTCLRLVEYQSTATGSAPKCIIMAHNSHVGDANATQHGGVEWNLGQMVRTTFGQENTFLVGFGTHNGTVTAAHEWGGEPETFELSPAEASSYSGVLHSALRRVRELIGQPSLNAFMLLLKAPGGAGDDRGGKAARASMRAAFGTPRRQRAIGVRYVKATEATSHYVQASLTAQFDAWIHVDRTSALIPLS